MQPSLYSFLILAGVILLIAGIGLYRADAGTPLLRAGLWVLIVIIFAGGWYMLRPTPSAQVATVAEVEAVIGSGQPVVLELYSEY